MHWIFALLLCGGMVGLIVGVTVNSSVNPVPPAPQQFEEGSGFLQRVCPCKTDWNFATNERLVSNQFFSQANPVPDPRGLSALVPFWGQLIDHDVVLGRSDPSKGHFTIEMTPFDAVINLTRAAARETGGCLEQRTYITPMIDATTVYGDHSTPERLAYLRISGSCKLDMSPEHMMPMKDNMFLAGDERATEHSFLTALHTLWVREHNRICDVLPATLTADEQFWKARQIVIAKIQHITYSEWLPTLMGSQFHLVQSIRTLGESTRVTMEFATLAFRVGHTMIPDPIGPFRLPSLFMNPQIIMEHGLEALFSAAQTTAAQQVDTKIIDGLRNFLFSAGPNIIGEDLVTRNLFRQRELQAPTYKQLVNCYSGLADPAANNDDDTFVSLLSEPLVAGSSLPRTIALVIAEQFKRLRDNDKRFYTKISGEIGNQFWNEVATTTLGKVIALNTGLRTSDTKVFFT